MNLILDQHQIIEAEYSVLGSVLVDPSCMDLIFNLLEPRDFVLDSHQLIWKAMRYQYQKNEPIDFITITNILKSYQRLDEVGGIDYLRDLAASVPITDNVKSHAEAIRSKSYRRRGFEAANKIIAITRDNEYENDEDYFHSIEKAVMSVRPQLSGEMKHLSETRQEYLNYLNETDDFIYTGFKNFDEWLGGVGRGWLYILAGRPSVGKSAKMLQTATNIAKQNKGPVLIWSQEMKRNQLINRMIASLSEVNGNRIRRKNFNEQEKQRIIAAYDELEKLPLHIEDGKRVTIDEIRTTVRTMERQHGKIAAVFVDYLTIMQIVQEKGETRSQAVGRVTRTAKDIAMEYNFPFFMLAQLSREGAGEPKLEHLRDSGEIEQDADVVEFLWHDPNDTDNRGKVIQSTIAKGRDIGVNNFRYLFKGWIQKYEEL